MLSRVIRATSRTSLTVAAVPCMPRTAVSVALPAVALTHIPSMSMAAAAAAKKKSSMGTAMKKRSIKRTSSKKSTKRSSSPTATRRSSKKSSTKSKRLTPAQRRKQNAQQIAARKRARATEVRLRRKEREEAKSVARRERKAQLRLRRQERQADDKQRRAARRIQLRQQRKERIAKLKIHKKEVRERALARRRVAREKEHDRQIARNARARAAAKRAAKKAAPKKARSAYMFFVMEKRPEILASNPGISVTEVSKKAGEMWRQLADKSKYENAAATDLERSHRERTAYNATKPKRPAGPYAKFTAQNFAAFKDANPSLKAPEIARKLGEKWRSLSQAEKAKYN